MDVTTNVNAHMFMHMDMHTDMHTGTVAVVRSGPDPGFGSGRGIKTFWRPGVRT